MLSRFLITTAASFSDCEWRVLPPDMKCICEYIE